MGMDPAQLSMDQLLEEAGESTAAEVKQLTLRGRGLASFAEWATQLPSLEGLSLSHNKLCGRLDGFSSLRQLVTLNVNNNALTSLEGLEGCTALQALFAANNRIRDLTPIASLARLRVLNCMSNSIASLDACCQVLTGLPHLVDLDLSGNPAANVPDACACLLAALPALRTLDGEPVAHQQLALSTRPLSSRTTALEPHAPVAQGSASKDSSGGGRWGSGHSSPQPPAGSAPGPHLRSEPSATVAPSNPNSGEGDRGGTFRQVTHTSLTQKEGHQGEGRTCLLSESTLKDHPLVLEYLAHSVLGQTPSQTVSAAGQAAGGPLPVRSSFASRLRATAAAMADAEALHPDDLARVDRLQKTLPSPNSSMVVVAQAALANASPQEIIRQLVKLSETLIVAAQVRHTADSSSRPSSSNACAIKPATPDAVAPQAAARTSPWPDSGRAAAPHQHPCLQSVQEAQHAAQAGNSSAITVGAHGGQALATAGSCPGRDACLHRAELLALRREVAQLRAENHNMYWLADDYKRLRSELAQLRDVHATGLHAN